MGFILGCLFVVALIGVGGYFWFKNSKFARTKAGELAQHNIDKLKGE